MSNTVIHQQLFINGLPVSDVKKKFIKFLVGVTNLPGSGFNESGSETLL